MSKKNGKSLWKEFTEFAIKGNAMALAVGTIIGAAFSTITGRVALIGPTKVMGRCLIPK